MVASLIVIFINSIAAVLYLHSPSTPGLKFNTTSDALANLSSDNSLEFDESSKFHIWIAKLKEEPNLNLKSLTISHHFEENEKVLIAFTSKKRSIIFWKHPENENVCMLNIEGDHNGFLAEFSRQRILKGFHFVRKGITESLQGNIIIDAIGLEGLTDKTGSNLLIYAAKENQLKIIKALLQNGFNANLEDKTDQKAIDYVWQKFTKAKNNKEQKALNKVIMTLLNGNSCFPKKFKYDEALKDVQGFVDMCHKLRDHVKNKSYNELLVKIKARKDLFYFFDIHNMSLMAHILKTYNYEAYKTLDPIEHMLKVADHENFNTLRDKMFEKQKITSKEDSISNAHRDPKIHKHVLWSSSKIANSRPENDENRGTIRGAFCELNKNEKCSKMLKVVATKVQMEIVFDLAQESTCYVDPETSITTRGIIYNTWKVFIAAKDLPDGLKKFGVFGTLNHELTHGAILLTFMNDFNPYPMGESIEKVEYEKMFNRIKKKYEENLNLEWIVGNALKYPEKEQHSELIVRSMQMDIYYSQDPTKLSQIHEEFKELYEFMDKFVLPAFEQALPVLKKLFNEDVEITFDELMKPMQAKILHTKIKFQGIETTFFDLFGTSTEIASKLSSDEIRLVLKGDEILEICSCSDFEQNDQDEHIIHRSFEMSGCQYTLEQITEQLTTFNVFILSATAGAGKSFIFKIMANNLKLKNPSFHVSFIKLSEHRETIKKYNGNNLLKILMEMLYIHSDLDVETFRFLFSKGKVILLFDGFDDISPALKETVIEIFLNINENTHNYLWISTRTYLTKLLEIELKTNSYTLVPLTKDEKIIIINKSFNKTANSKDRRNLESIFDIIESPRYGEQHSIDNPVMIENVSEVYIEDDSDFRPESLNLYKILNKCIEKLKLSEKSSIEDKLVDTNCNACHVFALKAIFKGKFETTSVESLAIMQSWATEQEKRENKKGKAGKEWYNEMVQRSGLFTFSLKNNEDTLQSVTFMHISIAEFYFVSYLSNFLFEPNHGMTDEEFKKIFDILRRISKFPKDFKIIHKILLGYIEENSDDVLNETVKGIIMDKISVIHSDIRDSQNTQESSTIWTAIFERHTELKKMLTDLKISEPQYNGKSNGSVNH